MPRKWEDWQVPELDQKRKTDHSNARPALTMRYLGIEDKEVNDIKVSIQNFQLDISTIIYLISTFLPELNPIISLMESQSRKQSNP